MTVNSDSVGVPAQFVAFEALTGALAQLPRVASDRGPVALVVTRGAGGLREVLARAHVTPDGGIPGDAWGRRAHPQRDGQIAVMQLDVATLIANGQPLTLFGDNLFLDLDLSTPNLPAGSRLRVGSAILEVTPKAHNGCRKFRARFGGDALRFVAHAERRHRNLRGIYMQVVEAGDVAPGDFVEVLARGEP